MRRRNEIIIWPVYFDSKKSRNEGRRLPKKLSVPSPSINMLEKAIKNLGLKYKVFPEASHPRLPWIKTGYIAVEKSGKPKNQLLKEIAFELIRLFED